MHTDRSTTGMGGCVARLFIDVLVIKDWFNDRKEIIILIARDIEKIIECH